MLQTCTATAGTLPVSYAGLSSLAYTALLLSGNNLTGGIPSEWGQRGPGLWSDLRLTNNSQLCGQVPEWFYSRFGADGPLLPTALLNGERRVSAFACQSVAGRQPKNSSRSLSLSVALLCRIQCSGCQQSNDAAIFCAATRLGSTCWPTTSFSNLLDVVDAYMPTVNRPLIVVLISRTSPALLGSNTWQLDVKGPNNAPVQTLGPLQHWPDYAQMDNITTFAYRLDVPGRQLSAVSMQSVITHDIHVPCHCMQLVVLGMICCNDFEIIRGKAPLSVGQPFALCRLETTPSLSRAA